MISYNTLGEAEMAQSGEIPQDEIRESMEKYGEIGKPQDALKKLRGVEDDDNEQNEDIEAQNKIVQEIAELVQSISELLGTLLSEYNSYKNTFDNSNLFNFLDEVPQTKQAFQIDSLQYDIGILQNDQIALLLFLENKSATVEDKLTEINIFLQNLKTKINTVSTDMSSLSEAVLLTQSTINTRISNAQYNQSSTQIFEELNQELYSLQYEVDRLVQSHSQVINQIEELDETTTKLTNSIDN